MQRAGVSAYPTLTHHSLAVVSLIGSSFDVLGALYLAYDVLGGRHGPLRTLTRAVTYGLLFGVGFGSIFGLGFGIAVGVTHGITLALELTRVSQGRPRYSNGWEALFSAIRGLGFGIGASFTHGFRFGIVFGTLSALGQIAAYRMGTRPEKGGPQWTAVAIRTAGYAIAGYISATVAHHQMHAAMFGEQAGLAIGVVTGVFTFVTPYIESVAETIPDKRLGVLGVALILIGFSLQSVQYWVALLDVPLS